jgi:thiol:disulfide interchange protein
MHMATTAFARAAAVVAFGIMAVGVLAPGTVAAPESADAVVAAALGRARAEHKVVLIEFGASWCVWCRRFEAFVTAPGVAPIVQANYVVTNLTVQERDDKKPLENPGGQALFDRWSGGKAGLPFYVFLDATGQKIGDSNFMPDGSNIGFPAVPEEIARFMMVIDRTAPRLTAAGHTVLQSYLERTAASREP